MQTIMILNLVVSLKAKKGEGCGGPVQGKTQKKKKKKIINAQGPVPAAKY